MGIKETNIRDWKSRDSCSGRTFGRAIVSANVEGRLSSYADFLGKGLENRMVGSMYCLLLAVIKKF